MKIPSNIILFLVLGVELVRVLTRGGWVEGEKRQLYTGQGTLLSFKGIPYAVPPVGKLRFKDPLPHPGWHGTRQATTFGPVCIQYEPSAQPVPIGSEDCLYINVYTPSLTPKKPYTVIVSIFEGGWKWGSGNDDRHGPDYLLAHDVVVVTFNYRLGAFGYLSLDNKEVPGNAGMKDQVLALKWVRDNIKYFGGNPDDVTIHGESSAGVSVVYHLMSPMTEGLFKRAISMSGVPLCDFAQAFQERERAFSLGKMLGADTNDDGELLEYLQKVPMRKLVLAMPSVISQEEIWKLNPFMTTLFVPVPEKDFGQERYLVDSALEILKKRTFRDTDLVLGYTNRELQIMIGPLELHPKGFRLFNQYKEMLIPREILLKISPDKILPLGNEIHQHYFGNQTINEKTFKNLVDHGTEYQFVYSIHRLLDHLPERKSKTYLYKFSTVSSRNQFSNLGEKFGVEGCAHVDDMRYIFHYRNDGFIKDSNSTEYRAINQTCSLITNFAKYGDPTPDSYPVKWYPFDKINRNYLNIDQQIIAGTNPDAKVVSWWRDIYQRNGIELP